jgi:hypothetical protein
MYKELLPAMGGYLTHAGDLHRGRLELLLGRLAAMEGDVLETRASETEEFESKRNSRRGGNGFGNNSGNGNGREPAWAAAPPKAPAAVSATELEEDDAFAVGLLNKYMRA